MLNFYIADKLSEFDMLTLFGLTVRSTVGAENEYYNPGVLFDVTTPSANLGKLLIYLYPKVLLLDSELLLGLLLLRVHS